MPSPAAARPRAAATPAFLALGCVGAFVSGPAFGESPAPVPADPAANDPGQVQAREDILVNGQRDRRGAKDVARPIDTPRSVVVLPEKVIKETGASTLADALRTIPGITFGAAEGGNPIGDRPFIRGFDSQGSTFVDGVRDPASQTREVFAVESVQIVRGSDSTLGGRGSAGGSINVISKLPELADFGTVDLSYGNADYKRGTFDVNRKLTDTIAVRIEGMAHDQDVAGRDAIWQKRWGVAPSISLGLGTPTRLTVAYYHLTTHELPDSGIPYLYVTSNAPGTGDIHTRPAIGDVTLISGETGHVSRDSYYGLAKRDFRDTTTDQGTIRVEHDFGGITLRNTARWSHNRQSFIFTVPDDSRGNVYGTDLSDPATAGGYVWHAAKSRYGYDESVVDQTDLFGKVKTGSVEHSFAIGTEISWEQARKGSYAPTSGQSASVGCTADDIAAGYCTSLFDPDPRANWVNRDASGNPAPIVRNGPASETQNDAHTLAAYAFDSITLIPQLILNLGARYDHFETKQTAGTPATSLKRSDDLFNWQAGLVYKPARDVSLYASYATAATPPNSLLGEGREDNALTPGRGQAAIDVNDLKPQKTRSYEVGAKANLFHERLALTAAAFQTETKNARVTGADGNVDYIGETRIRGIELTANGEILPGWSVFGGYTYLDPVISDGGFTVLTAAAVGDQAAQTVLVPSVTTGKQAPNTAKNSFTLWTTLQATKRFQIGGGAFYTGKQYGGYASNPSATQDAAGVVTIHPATQTLFREIPGYWRFDARAAYQLTDHIGLSVNAQNLTDKVYFTQAYASHYATIAPGRTVFGTIEVTF
ncbi:TonB-dependent receptor [Hephaestia mangrovi]|uniref:TonB-dependent receptor n=1 Tax=Hephaestia mangrovi TaxID=2873268 RepID=UPI001CA6EECD|nr:TonB-dependent receptor [Hephaestia mangrovi]MBY8828325.1 TonB-dependent receptor [Hephaestia mangrovi]